jgi:hypothetical protein
MPAPVPVPAVTVAPAAPARNGSQPAAKDAVSLEQATYDYVKSSNGAKLTDIESALGMNRFQAVDTLRSLIKQGLIVQRDRLYLAQDQA